MKVLRSLILFVNVIIETDEKHEDEDPFSLEIVRDSIVLDIDHEENNKSPFTIKKLSIDFKDFFEEV